MAAGFGSCCNLCDSATAKGCGGFFPAGDSALYRRLPPKVQKSHLWGICSFHAFHMVIFGCVCGDFWFPSAAIFITYVCEVYSIRHNLIVQV